MPWHSKCLPFPWGEKVTNCSSIEIYNYVPFKANGNFIIICDAAFLEKNGKSAYDMAMHFTIS